MNNIELVFKEDEFYNPSYKQGFIDEKYDNYSDKSKLQIFNVFKKIAEIETEKGKDIALFDLEDFRYLFEKNKWISASVITNKQSIIREYMRWYRKQGYPNWEDCKIPDTIDRIEQYDLTSDRVYESELFLSLDELKDCVKILYDAYNGIDDRELDMPITLMYLAWHDVDSLEALEIEKSHVSITADQIYLPKSEKFIDVDSSVMEFIRDYAASEGYSILARGETVSPRQYRPTTYLLRTTRSDKLTENNMRATLSKISDLYEESGKYRRFKYEKIQLSGIYEKLIIIEKQYGILSTKHVDVFERYFRENYQQNTTGMAKFYNRLKDFQKYKEYRFSKGLA